MFMHKLDCMNVQNIWRHAWLWIPKMRSGIHKWKWLMVRPLKSMSYLESIWIAMTVAVWLWTHLTLWWSLTRFHSGIRGQNIGCSIKFLNYMDISPQTSQKSLLRDASTSLIVIDCIVRCQNYTVQKVSPAIYFMRLCSGSEDAPLRHRSREKSASMKENGFSVTLVLQMNRLLTCWILWDFE